MPAWNLFGTGVTTEQRVTLQGRPWLLLSLCLGVCASVGRAQTTVANYRYTLDSRSQDPIYVQEVPPTVSGQHVTVERDARGRLMRATVVRNGKTNGRTVYQFDPGKPFATGYEWFTGDELAGRVAIQRNPNGDRAREDDFTVTGTLTGYTVYAYRSDTVEESDYTGAGKLTTVSVETYSTQGRRLSRVAYTNPEDRTSHIDTQYDENTGQARTRKQFRSAAVVNTRSFVYNADGDLIREDGYSPSGEPYVFREFAEGLEVRRAYKSGDQITQEYRYSFDENRWRKEADLYSKGVLVCRFTYDRLSDGTVKRTIATGPGGELWAEYPDNDVIDVRQDGQAQNGRAAVIHKTGNWF